MNHVVKWYLIFFMKNIVRYIGKYTSVYQI